MTPALAGQVAVLVAVQDGRHQALLEMVELDARVAQPGHLHDRLRSQPQAGTRRQREQLDAARRDVLPHAAGGDVEALRAQLVVQLAVDEVHLAEVGLARVAGHPGAMLDGPAQVGVALDPQSGQQTDTPRGALAERVLRVAADGLDDAGAWVRAHVPNLASRTRTR
jgi:hypothetical protein